MKAIKNDRVEKMVGFCKFAILTTKLMSIQCRSNAEGLYVEEIQLSKEEIYLMEKIYKCNKHDFAQLQMIFRKFASAGFKIGLKKAELLIKNASQQ